MSVIDELVPLLKKLRLSGVLQSLALRLREASEEGVSENLCKLTFVGDLTGVTHGTPRSQDRKAA